MTRLLVAVASLCVAAALMVGVLSMGNTSSPEQHDSSPAPVAMQGKRTAPPPESRDSAPEAPSPSASASEADRPEARNAPDTPPRPAKNSLDVEYQAQKTGYWCGPAAARIALSSKTDELPDQAALAGELGTTRNGTDHIRQVTEGLNAQLAGTGTHYRTRDWGGSAKPQQLWTDTVRNVDDGKAIVANIVASPGNQPPGYPSSSTIYHYVTIIGYNAANKTVHIADPRGFGGHEEYWLSLEQATSLIQPKGYAA